MKLTQSLVITAISCSLCLNTLAGTEPSVLVMGAGNYEFNSTNNSLLPVCRELFRQALEISAMDHGWQVYDKLMFDAVPAGVAERFDQSYVFYEGNNPRFKVSIANRADHQILYEREFQADSSQLYDVLATGAEEAATSTFAEYFTSKPLDSATFDLLPEDEYEALRDKFDIISQFHFIRQAYARKVRNGESAKVLMDLV